MLLDQIVHQLPLLHEHEYSYGLPRMSGLRVFPGRLKAYPAQIFSPSLSYLNRLNGPKLRYNSLEKRWRTAQSGHEKSGHINAGPNEGIFFLDSMSPTQAPENPPQPSNDRSRCVSTATQLHPGPSIFQCRKVPPTHFESLPEPHFQHRPCDLDRASYTTNPPNKGPGNTPTAKGRWCICQILS